MNVVSFEWVQRLKNPDQYYLSKWEKNNCKQLAIISSPVLETMTIKLLHESYSNITEQFKDTEVSFLDDIFVLCFITMSTSESLEIDKTQRDTPTVTEGPEKLFVQLKRKKTRQQAFIILIIITNTTLLLSIFHLAM